MFDLHSILLPMFCLPHLSILHELRPLPGSVIIIILITSTYMCVGLTVFNSCNSKQLQEVARKVDFKYSISTCSFATILVGQAAG